MIGYELNVTGQTLYVFAFDSTTGKGKTGEAANITIFYQEKGGASTDLAQTITEVDATNMPGVYSAPIPQGVIDTQYTFFHPKCSTANIGMAPAPPAFLVPAGFSTNPMRGTDSALLAASAPTNFADLAIVASTGLVSANMAQTLPVTPTADTTGDALKRASVGIPQSAAGAIGGLALVDNLFGPVISGSVNDVTPLAGNFDCGGDVSTTTGDHNKQYCWFTSGPLKGNFRSITTHTGGTPPNLAFTGTGNNDVPFDAAPNNGDTFIITGYDGSLP